MFLILFIHKVNPLQTSVHMTTFQLFTKNQKQASHQPLLILFFPFFESFTFRGPSYSPLSQWEYTLKTILNSFSQFEIYSVQFCRLNTPTRVKKKKSVHCCALRLTDRKQVGTLLLSAGSAHCLVSFLLAGRYPYGEGGGVLSLKAL